MSVNNKRKQSKLLPFSIENVPQSGCTEVHRNRESQLKIEEAIARVPDHLDVPSETIAFNSVSRIQIQSITNTKMDQTSLDLPSLSPNFELPRVNMDPYKRLPFFHGTLEKEADVRCWLNTFLQDSLIHSDLQHVILLEHEVALETTKVAYDVAANLQNLEASKTLKRYRFTGVTDFVLAVRDDSVEDPFIHVVAIKSMRGKLKQYAIDQCFAVAAIIYNTNKDRGIHHVVWGVLSSVDEWMFIKIAEDGTAACSELYTFNFTLRLESEVRALLKVLISIIWSAYESTRKAKQYALAANTSIELPDETQ